VLELDVLLVGEGPGAAEAGEEPRVLEGMQRHVHRAAVLVEQVVTVRLPRATRVNTRLLDTMSSYMSRLCVRDLRG
jgi:hypothetical protein